jgi:hypothetical protein
MIMKLLPPRSEGRMSKCCWYKRPRCINGFTACILKDPFGLYGFLDIFSGLEKFMKE